jgi:hypothetical protein
MASANAAMYSPEIAAARQRTIVQVIVGYITEQAIRNAPDQ